MTQKQKDNEQHNEMTQNPYLSYHRQKEL